MYFLVRFYFQRMQTLSASSNIFFLVFYHMAYNGLVGSWLGRVPEGTDCSREVLQKLPIMGLLIDTSAISVWIIIMHTTSRTFSGRS
jgi:hypothetical protein